MKKNYIALGGLFACLHLLFLFMAKVIVGSELLLVLFLPLLSTIYTLKCEKKSVLMFVLATLFLCFVFDFVSTFIYVIPSLICGIVYGILRKNKFKELEVLCISGITHMISISISFLVIVFLFKEINFMGIFEKIFSLEGNNLIVVTLLFLFVLGFCEAFLVHIVADNELKKIGNVIEKNDSVPKWFGIVSLVSFIFYVVMSILGIVYCLLPLFVFLVFLIPYIINGLLMFNYKFLTFSIMIIFLFVSIFIIQYLEPINYLILPIFVISPLIINNFGDNKRKKLLKE